MFRRLTKWFVRVGLFSVMLLVTIQCTPAANIQNQVTSADSNGELKSIVISEPAHNLGYLPLYAAINEGFFENAGLDVETLLAVGGGHVTTVISDDAWGFIGGPESAAFANQKGQNIKTIVNVVNRANVYMVARTGLEPPASNSDEELRAFLDGKTVVGGRYGGTPNLLARYLITSVGLTPGEDVKMIELADGSAVNAQMQQEGDVAYVAEPQITTGIQQGIWGEPFFSFPEALGDYAYSTINVKETTYNADPEMAEDFVSALIEGIHFINENPEEALRIAKQEFPAMDETQVKAALDRAYQDNLWTKDGSVSQKALENAMDIPTAAGLYKGTYTYDALVDMAFIKS
ncbi:MAG: ABC transporter substrate-binding protein [Elainellaceae cyanobacterium]